VKPQDLNRGVVPDQTPKSVQRIKDIRGLKYPEVYLIRFFFKHGLQNAPGRVLEAGCANGCNLRLFREFDWETVGIDISREAIADGEENFAGMHGAESSFRFILHDLSKGLPQNLEGPFDCVLFPSSLYYIPRASVIQVFRDTRRFVRPGAAFYLRMRTVADFRFGRGEPAEPNGFRLTTEVTGEKGVLNVFYHEYELVDMLRDHLGVNPARMRVMRVDYQNVQNDIIVSNADVVMWGRLPS
jgi:SAM-dependent methyltransferase